MSDQKNDPKAPVQPHPRLTLEELERLRPQEGMTAAEFDKIRRDNQPSSLRETEEVQETEGDREIKEIQKPAATKTAAKRTTPAKKTATKKAAATKSR